MSHSLTERSAWRYCAVLGAEGVGLGRWHGQQHQWLGSRGFACQAAHPAWSAALEALGQLLAEQQVQGGPLQVLLSARFSRFCLVPWSDAISHPRELQAYAQACFEDLYGQALDDWRIVLSAEPAGAARIATALPAALLLGLQALAKAHQQRLRSVQPYLMAAYNHCVGQLPPGEFLFVLAEPRRSVLLLAAHGAWQQVLAQGCADDDQALEALIERTGELYGEALPQVFLHAPGRQAGSKLAAVQLCAPAPGPDPLCAMWRAVA